MNKLHDEPEWIFPYQDMHVGDSFFIPTMKPSEMISAMHGGAKRLKIKVRTYITLKNNHIGVRCWRIL